MSDVLSQLLGEISDAYDKTEGYIVYDLLKAVALVFEAYDIELGDIRRLLDVNNLSGPMLDAYITQRKGIERNKATFSVGTLDVLGNGTIKQDDLFETRSGIQFQSLEQKVITDSGTLNVRAVLPGVSGNVPATQIRYMPVTLPGITSVSNSSPTHDGYDEETDDDYRERYYIAIRTPPTSGNVYHYMQWAKSIPGVGDVKVLPLERGPNTVELVLIDQQKQPASSTLVQQVQTLIDPGSKGIGNGEAPIGAFCYVNPATALTVNISVSVTIDSSFTQAQVKANIEQSIREYLKRIAFTQPYVSFAAVGNAIFEAEGVVDHSGLKVNGGTANVNIGTKQVPVLGAVTLV